MTWYSIEYPETSNIQLINEFDKAVVKLKHTFTPYTKIERFKDLNTRHVRHHRTPRREYRQNILWHKSYQCFLNRNKSKNKRDLIKLTSKGIHKMKRQPPEWETIFANDMTDKGLILKQLIQLNNNFKKHPAKKWAEDLNRYFSKDTDGQLACEEMLKTANY